MPFLSLLLVLMHHKKVDVIEYIGSFREEDGRTVVDVEVATLSTPENFNRKAIQDAVKHSVSAAISDGEIGGYNVYTTDPPVLTVDEPKKGAC